MFLISLSRNRRDLTIGDVVSASNLILVLLIKLLVNAEIAVRHVRAIASYRVSPSLTECSVVGSVDD